jgi:uncharacterized phage protein (predicted DNA packaging)
MKWLTIDYIKQHSRIDFDCDDQLLELYADSAEETILDMTRRTFDELKEMGGGKIPAKLYHAGLLLVDNWYNNRSSAGVGQLYTVPYGNVDFLIKNFMKLSD